MKFSRFALVLALVCQTAVTLRAGEENDLLAEVLPPETYVYFQLPDASARRPGYEGSVVSKIAANPEMAAFLKDCDASERRVAEEIAGLANLTPEFVQSLLRGRISGAVIDLRSEQDGTLNFTWVLAARLESAVDEKQLFSAIKAGVNRALGRQATGKDFALGKVSWEENWTGGHNVLMIAHASPLRFVLLDRTLLFYQGPDSEMLKQLLANYDNPLKAKSLGRDALYQAAHKGAEAAPGMSFLYANTARIYTALRAINLPRTTRLLDVLGLSGVQALGCSGGFYMDGQRHTLYLYAPRERRGLLKTLGMSSRAEDAAGLSAKEAGWLVSARLNLSELYVQIPLLIDSTEELFERNTRLGLAEVAGKQQLFGVPATDILATMGDALALEPAPSGWVLRLDNAKPSEFHNVVQRLEAGLGGQFTAEAVRCSDGQTRVVKYFNRSGQPVPAAPSYCLYGQREDGTGVVYLATCPQSIKSILRQPRDGTLKARPDFARVMEGMGSGYVALAYVDNADSYARVYDALLPLANAWLAVNPQAPDPGKLPPGSDIAANFFGCALGVKNNPDGITFTSYGPLGMNGLTAFLLDKLLVSNPASITVAVAETARWLYTGNNGMSGDAIPGANSAPDGGRLPGIGQ